MVATTNFKFFLESSQIQSKKCALQWGGSLVNWLLKIEMFSFTSFFIWTDMSRTGDTHLLEFYNFIFPIWSLATVWEESKETVNKLKKHERHTRSYGVKGTDWRMEREQWSQVNRPLSLLRSTCTAVWGDLNVFWLHTRHIPYTRLLLHLLYSCPWFSRLFPSLDHKLSWARTLS